MIKNRYSHYSYVNKLAAHKPYFLFRNNSSKYNDTLLISFLAKEETRMFGSRQQTYSSSKTLQEIFQGIIYTNNNVSDVAIPSKLFKEQGVIETCDLPIYRSLFCVFKDKPPEYKEVIGKQPNSKKYF